MLSERTIINGLILIAGMILGPYLIILTFEVNQLALLAFGCIVFLFIIFFLVEDRISAFPLLGTYFTGGLSFLPFSAEPVEIFSLMTILYYFINYVALKRKPLDIGPIIFLVPMLVIGGIVLYHDHSLGLHALGSTMAGSRPGLLILIAIAAYICGINTPSPTATFLSRVPWYCLLLNCIASAPYAISTYFPSTAPYLIYFTGYVNVESYVESVSSTTSLEVGRNASLLIVGGLLQSILVSYYPINTWWRPQRWICIVLSLMSLWFVLMAGYRNFLLSFIVITVLAAICYSRWRAILILPVITVVLLGLVAFQSNRPNGMSLPPIVQRSLSFVPGNWDSEVLNDTESSNDFRQQIVDIYMKEYFHQSPLIGNGFTFDPGEYQGLLDMANTRGISDRSYFETKSLMLTKNFHVGWISLYDAVGIIGGLAFIFLELSLIFVAGRFVFQQNADMASPLYPLKVWLFCVLTEEMVKYFTTFGSFHENLVSMCAAGIVLVHLTHLERRKVVQITSPSPQVPLGMPNRSEIFSPSTRPAR